MVFVCNFRIRGVAVEQVFQVSLRYMMRFFLRKRERMEGKKEEDDEGGNKRNKGEKREGKIDDK